MSPSLTSGRGGCIVIVDRRQVSHASTGGSVESRSNIMEKKSCLWGTRELRARGKGMYDFQKQVKSTRRIAPEFPPPKI
jgi:hypothetical protein